MEKCLAGMLEKPPRLGQTRPLSSGRGFRVGDRVIIKNMVIQGTIVTLPTYGIVRVQDCHGGTFTVNDTNLTKATGSE